MAEIEVRRTMQVVFTAVEGTRDAYRRLAEQSPLRAALEKTGQRLWDAQGLLLSDHVDRYVRRLRELSGEIRADGKAVARFAGGSTGQADRRGPKSAGGTPSPAAVPGDTSSLQPAVRGRAVGGRAVSNRAVVDRAGSPLPKGASRVGRTSRAIGATGVTVSAPGQAELRDLADALRDAADAISALSAILELGIESGLAG